MASPRSDAEEYELFERVAGAINVSRQSSQETPLPPTDRGRGAWMALLACSMIQLPSWGMSMSFGVFQDYYSSHHAIGGDLNTTGIIGTTLTGLLYLSMPPLFALLTSFPYLRSYAAWIGSALAALSLLLSSFSTTVTHLIVTQGILRAIGCSMLYSPTTLNLDSWFTTRKGLAYGVILSAKGLIGSLLPFMFSALLSRFGIRWTLRAWSAAILLTSLPFLAFIRHRSPPPPHSARRPTTNAALTTSLKPLLSNSTFWLFQLSNTLFNLGYVLPQTYISTYSTQILHTSPFLSSLILALLSAPGIIASLTFGLLSDGLRLRRAWRPLNIYEVTALSSVTGSLPAFFLWGFGRDVGALVGFSVLFGFFAGGYSATWSGVIREIRQEEEAASFGRVQVDTGLIFGLLNGGRGIGYVLGGVVGVDLLKDGALRSGVWGYGSQYGRMILFTGVSALLGSLSACWKVGRTLCM
ncbi:MAG: hypothetical protein Q9227_005749 [Pyrenula ochraceoflavens]